MNKTLGNIRDWFRNNGDYTHRLEYNLNEDSIVFDVGGYEGWFTEQINNKYKSKIYCFEPIIDLCSKIQIKFESFNNIFVYSLAISDKNNKETIYFNKDASSTNIKTGIPIEINCATLDKVMSDNSINNIDLLKINIEGDEYKLLEYMIINNLHTKCKNIQVQFHKIVDNYETRYDYIKYQLEKTHHLTYNYPFVWENWEINSL